MADFGLAMADLDDRAESAEEAARSTADTTATLAATAAEATVKIRALSSDGAGVGNLADGRVVFVPRTAPGDEVLLRITEGKPRWARGRLLDLLVPSPDRVTPACPYYDECGGCTMQHVAYAQQLHWKGDTVREALKRISHVDIAAPDVVPSPNERNYRSRMTFTLVRLPGGRVVAGFHHLGVPHRIVDVEEGCILPEPAVASAWIGLRKAWGEGARRLPSGRKLRLTLRVVDEGVILVVDGGRGPGRPDILLREVEGLVAVWASTSDGSARLLAGLEHVHDTRLGETVRTGPTTFLQVNTVASEALHRWVVEQGGVTPGEEDETKVVDAYCGVGFYGRDLARLGAQVLGIERDPEAAGAASRDAPEGFTVCAGAVEDRLADALPADLVVLNPPRIGVDATVTETLVTAGPPRLIYVSCDPATLARDIGRLSSAYEVVDVRAFDLFPQTAHVEVVVVLKRTGDE
ncbi:MAG: class I SAM-dependent RNA methyltransferase [Gemmatimonadetes bacterium]|nr:class I SAM-dependent RNA methyltransferase [Gemmatimonadota bacterium]